VCKFTDRVFKALLDIKDEVIAWPDAEERKQISDRMGEKYGLPGAVGIVDGTPIVFTQRPKIDGEVFWTRKCQYAYNLQLVCDDKKRIRYYVIGWPGSVYDSTVFDSSDLLMRPHLFFIDGEFLLADSGYALTKWVCVPYRLPLANIPHNFRFNFYFSSARCLIEHVNGMLKTRWMSLKGISTQIREHKDFESVNKWILVCLILHNLMIKFEDEEWENEEEEEEVYNDVTLQLREECTSGNDLRLRVQQHLLEWSYGGVVVPNI
jgi:hypothetical protein